MRSWGRGRVRVPGGAWEWSSPLYNGHVDGRNLHTPHLSVSSWSSPLYNGHVDGQKLHTLSIAIHGRHLSQWLVALHVLMTKPFLTVVDAATATVSLISRSSDVEEYHTSSDIEGISYIRRREFDWIRAGLWVFANTSIRRQALEVFFFLTLFPLRNPFGQK